MVINDIKEVLESFQPVGLDEIGNSRLMNRVDTKYLISLNKIPHLMGKMDGAYRALEIDNSRIFSYFTTYLDTDDFLFYNQHVTGRLNRNKVRYRRYETTGLTFLEVKRRTRKNRTIKWRIEHSPDPGNKYDETAYEFLTEHLPETELKLSPVLVSSFKRITLVGSDINEKITIDQDLAYHDLVGNQVKFPFLAIIEHKRERLINGSPISNIIKDNLIHPTGFSKYCFGTASIYDIPHKNNLKPKFLLINKIENEFNKSSDT